jgi:1-deoxy-D-xylulose-5-phosphate synthase
MVEENVLAGGFSSAVLEMLADKACLQGLKMQRIGLPDRFIEHGRPEELRKLAGVDQESIKQTLLRLLN